MLISDCGQSATAGVVRRRRINVVDAAATLTTRRGV
jgi:hypothetical protein